MNKQEIDWFVSGLVEAAGSRELNDIIAHLGILLRTVPAASPLLHGGLARYVRTPSFEAIYLSDELPDEARAFTIAHEIGHAILHDPCELSHVQQLYKTGEKESDASYFATKLIDLSIDPIEWEGYSTEQIAAAYGVREDAVLYIAKKEKAPPAATGGAEQ